MMSYQRHIFFCNNVREDGTACCSQLSAGKLYAYAKDKCRAAGRLGIGKIGVSESRCLGKCEFGPVAVIYPDNIWYKYINSADIDEIITEHLEHGRVVRRLQIQ
ncbi:MAG: (2Fe-2S) ferredoxin domain-containing protein [Candidatus Thioglobus sp.]|nr:(2Fe-2S) ferredoxin domain-containing protein [Candidatus Thioglobus sp.]